MTIERVAVWLCKYCLDGKGGECHEPGCILIRCKAPEWSIRDQATPIRGGTVVFRPSAEAMHQAFFGGDDD